MPAVTIDETRIRHIFRRAGHFSQDTLLNRQALIDVASNPQNYIGTDRFGTEWFVEVRPDGTQVWAQVRSRKITNGDLNLTPQDFDLDPKP
jgi:hypothetical protein